MKKFSLILPTRDREKKFNGFLRSIQVTCQTKENIELLVVCDVDDTTSQAYVQKAQKEHGNLDIKLLTRDRSEMLNRDYYNFAAYQSEGELIWIVADDLEMTQIYWDVRITNALDLYLRDKPDRICCISAKDNTPPPSHKLPKFPCFPIFTREAMNFYGWTVHPQPPTWGTDYITYLIYKGANRLLELHDTNYINHVSVHTHQCGEDAISLRIGGIFNRLKMKPEFNTDRIIADQVPGLIDKLKKHIGGV